MFIEEKAIEELTNEIFLNCSCGLSKFDIKSIARFVIKDLGYRRVEDNEELVGDYFVNDTSANRCVSCGAIIPEGRIVCYKCEGYF